jgi:multidrug efflux pump subunit AcrA (membrane-fusion protein)
MRKLVRWAVRLLVALAVLVGIGYGLYRWLIPSAAAGPREETHVAEVMPMEDVLLVAGLVKPAVTIDLRAEASGIVESVAVKEGDRVATGQVLVRLDSKLAQSAVDQAEANLRQAELQDEATKLDLDLDALEVRRAALDRAQKLHAQGLLPKDQLELKELEYRSAVRAVERAKRSIASSQSRITQAKAALDQARTQLTHTTIRAPFDAFVLRRQVEVGSGVAGVSQSASGGSILMTLGDARESSLFARATAADARRLKPGQVARVRLDSDATQQLPAVVVSVSTAGGWVNVPAQAEIVLSSTVDSVTIPEWCVRTDSSGRSSIQVQGAAGNRWRVVEVGVVQKDRIQIRSGLDKGQTVVCRARP